MCEGAHLNGSGRKCCQLVPGILCVVMCFRLVDAKEGTSNLIYKPQKQRFSIIYVTLQIICHVNRGPIHWPKNKWSIDVGYVGVKLRIPGW